MAEVLITLGIIGVVATMTIPTLMNNIQNEQFHSAYKKEYSVFSNATKQILLDNGGYLWDTTVNRGKNMSDAYAKYLHIAKIDTMGNIFNYKLTAYDKRGGTVDIPNGVTSGGDSTWPPRLVGASNYAFVLNDGSIVGLDPMNPYGTSPADWWAESNTPATHYYYGIIYVDVNGIKPSNRIGVDFYTIWVTYDIANGIYRIDAGNVWFPSVSQCGYGSWWSYGFGCGQYILQNQPLPTTAQSP